MWRRWFWSPYPTTVWWAKDVLWNGLLGGARKQTISDRIGDKLRAGRLWAWLLDLPFMGHFRRTEEPHDVGGSSAGMLLFAVGFLAALTGRWMWPVIAVRWVETPFYTLLLVWLMAQLAARKLGREPAPWK